MTDLKEPNSPEFIVTFADFRAILRKYWKRTRFCMISLALCAFLFAVSRPVVYQTNAVFHQKGKSTAGLQTDVFQSLLAAGQTENEGLAAMKSHRLSRELAKSHALQVEITKDEYRFPFLPISYIIDNLKLEYALWNGAQFPVVQERSPIVVARQVTYDKIIPTSFSLEVLSPETYVLKNGSTVVAQGSFGQPLITEEFTIILDFKGDASRDLGKYNLTLKPLDKVAEHLQKIIFVATDLVDKNLLKISYKHPDRQSAVDHVNSLMGLYQKYVNDEHKRIAKAQLEYLVNRQQAMGDQLKEMMQEHAKALSSDLTATGFATSQMAMEFLAKNQQNLKQKLLTIELEIQRLESINNNAISDFDKFLSIGSSDWINHIIAEMRSLKQQADSLSLALRSSSMAMSSYEESFNSQLIELDEIKSSAEEGRNMLASLKNDKLPEAGSKLMGNPRFIVKSWYDRLVASRETISKTSDSTPTDWQKTKEGFSSYLTHLIDYLQVHQRNIEERLNHQQSAHAEFQGISPNTAKELYIAYCRELNDKESKALRLKYVIGHLSEPEFEISSLSTILDDSTSHEMISKATNTSLALKDTENRSTKEQDRLRADLALQKSFLSSHLKQTVDLLELNQKLLREKIYSLQSINLSLLQNEMSVLEHQMKQYILSTIDAHRREKTLLEQNLNEIRIEMASLPQKWAAEQLIDQQMAMNRNMIEEISRLVETKNITSNLEKVQSAPLDLPFSPVHPKPPKLVLFTLFGAFIGLILGSIWAIGSSIAHGVEASLDNMKVIGKHVSGYLSAQKPFPSSEDLLDGDLETLRRIIAFMNESNDNLDTDSVMGKSILLLCGKGPQYAKALAKLLAKSGKKTAVVDLYFDKISTKPGLLQYLKGESKDLPIHHDAGFDIVGSGGISRYANEFLSGTRFKEAVQDLMQQYDWVLFSSDSTLDSPEAETLLNIFPRAALTITKETLQEISRPLSLITERKIQTTFLSAQR